MCIWFLICQKVFDCNKSKTSYLDLFVYILRVCVLFFSHFREQTSVPAVPSAYIAGEVDSTSLAAWTTNLMYTTSDHPERLLWEGEG